MTKFGVNYEIPVIHKDRIVDHFDYISNFYKFTSFLVFLFLHTILVSKVHVHQTLTTGQSALDYVTDTAAE